MPRTEPLGLTAGVASKALFLLFALRPNQTSSSVKLAQKRLNRFCIAYERCAPYERSGVLLQRTATFAFFFSHQRGIAYVPQKGASVPGFSDAQTFNSMNLSARVWCLQRCVRA